MKSPKAFTLIELLVVISMIALLLSLLMPSLRQAKYQAERILCFNNMKNQYLSTTMYADDNDSRLPENRSGYLNVKYLKPTGGGPIRNNAAEVMMDYFEDYKIFICPILAKEYRNTKYEHFWNPYYIRSDFAYGNWGGRAPDGSLPNHIQDAYLWTMNFSRDVVYLDGEPQWPKKMTDGNSRNVFIMHEIYQKNANFRDWSHGGLGWTLNSPTFETDSEDNPYCFGDGHIEWRVKNKLKNRAIIPAAGYIYIY